MGRFPRISGLPLPGAAALTCDRGATLIGVMGIIAAVLLIGVAIFILGHSEGDMVEYEVDDARAFWLAEAGLEHARGYIEALQEDDPSAVPVGDDVTGAPVNGGTYRAIVVADTSGGGWLDAYSVISTGWQDGVPRQVRANMLAETFAIYSWFIESGGGGYSWFRTGEVFEGPVHSNGGIKIKGDPWFGGLVTCVGDLIITEGNPTFVQGYETGVDLISLPTRDEVRASIRTAALESDGIYLESMGNKTYYDIVLGDPALGWLTYTGREEDGTEIAGHSGTVEIAGTNGALWSEEAIWIKGTLDGQLTIGVDNNIHIRDDVLYAGYGNPNNDDMLGLIAAGQPDGDIIIDYTLPNQSDVEVHAVMMSLQKTIMAEDYNQYDPRGVFHLYGGVLSDYAIHISYYDSNDNVIHGYVRDYDFDPRATLLPPPFFPTTGNYRVVTWEEIVPPNPTWF